MLKIGLLGKFCLRRRSAANFKFARNLDFLYGFYGEFLSFDSLTEFGI